MFSDTFQTIDPTIWTARTLYESIVREGGLPNQYVAANVSADTDGLHILAERVGDEYKSGWLESYQKKAWLHGYFEAKIKYPDTPGIWTQFFTVNDAGWPPEIDSGEAFTNDGLIQFAIRKEVGTDYLLRYIGPVECGEWHTFGVLWEADKVVIYVDGYERCRFTEWVPSLPMNAYFILGMGEFYEPDDSQLPASLDVEYFKVWQK